MENLKLVHQLFIGKVADEIGIERTTQLLKEAKEAFAIPDVVGRSEQLVCDCVIPKPKDAYDEPDKYYCRDCNGRIAN